MLRPYSSPRLDRPRATAVEGAVALPVAAARLCPVSRSSSPEACCRPTYMQVRHSPSSRSRGTRCWPRCSRPSPISPSGRRSTRTLTPTAPGPSGSQVEARTSRPAASHPATREPLLPRGQEQSGTAVARTSGLGPDRRVDPPARHGLGRGADHPAESAPGHPHRVLTLRDPSVDNSLTLTCPPKLISQSPVPVTEGSRVIVQGTPRFYTGRGSFSLQVSEIRPVGVGELLARIERLKQALASEGLFDPRLKRTLPFLPLCRSDHRPRECAPSAMSWRWRGAAGPTSDSPCATPRSRCLGRAPDPHAWPS